MKKLTRAQYNDIISSQLPIMDIARKHGINHGTVLWHKYAKQQKVFVDDYAKIANDNRPNKIIAREYGISPNTVSNIKWRYKNGKIKSLSPGG